MNREIKLLILILLSLSVYFIYNLTKESNIKILTLGDGLSLGIDSYTMKTYSYTDYYKDYLKENNKQAEVINYSKKDLSIHELLKDIKTNPTLKRNLTEAHILFLNVGYNDLNYKLSMDEINMSKLNKIINDINLEYKELLKEINKYYKNEIIVIGYPKSNLDNYYYNIGIRKLNSIIKNDNYIDTYSILTNRKKYFSNPNSYYPNRLGYEKIYEEIVSKLNL